jgi:hypothetical protein
VLSAFQDSDFDRLSTGLVSTVPQASIVGTSALVQTFPEIIEDVHFENSVPFSKKVFNLIIEKFQLPPSTPWLFFTDSSHTQIYIMNENASPSPRIGKMLSEFNYDPC